MQKRNKQKQRVFSLEKCEKSVLEVVKKEAKGRSKKERITKDVRYQE